MKKRIEKCRPTWMVMCRTPREYRKADHRLNKPICLTGLDGWAGRGKSTAVLQATSEMRVCNESLEYFTPNNIAVLLSISQKSTQQARAFFEEHFRAHEKTSAPMVPKRTRKDILFEKSKWVCDYIELIQTSLVFAYTSLETFANLSIPDSYVFAVQVKTRGTVEHYGKDAIERWVALRDKLDSVLPDIYRTSKPSMQPFWGLFVKLEDYRNQIVHQKSITSTEFYKRYFERDIFRVCNSPIDVMGFFFDESHGKNYTNPLWPWLINRKNVLPVRASGSSEIELIESS
jgi:hypothetical protein